MSEGGAVWIGESGFEHVFHVYGRADAIPPRRGLYIYCRKDLEGVWLPVHMGQGDLSVCCEDPEMLACIDAKGATHIHMRLCASPDERAAELADLLAKHSGAYAPRGCHAVVPAPAEAASGGPDSLATA